MKPGHKLVLAIAAAVGLVAVMLAAYFALVLSTLEATARARYQPLLAACTNLLPLLGAMLVIGAGLVLAPLFRKYVVAPLRLAQGTRIIATANAAHRLATEGSAELRELAAAVNVLADHHETAMREAQAQAAEAREAAEREKNQLAALMAELAHSVIVCNLEGRVLLYNTAAQELFSQPDMPLGNRLLGLGRSVFALIDRTLVAHGLERLNEQIARGVSRPSAHLITATRTGRLLRAQMAPVRTPAQAIDGYILTFTDAGEEFVSGQRRDELLLTLTEGTRATLANVQAAAEALAQADELDAARRSAFLTVIREEVERHARRLAAAVREHADVAKARWPLDEMHGAALIAMAQQRIEHITGSPIRTVAASHEGWLRIDSYALVQALAYLARRLHETYGAAGLFLQLHPNGRYAELELGACDIPGDGAPIEHWEHEPLSAMGELEHRTVRGVIERQGGEIWHELNAERRIAHFRLLLPLAERPPLPFAPAVIHESRPEFYDFDLFRQPGLTAALENRRLAELSYTVFDTETTGLAPSQGDEIIAIGAVRIVNGRVLAHEAFEQLIDPQQPLTAVATQITGIETAMLKGQPKIATILPLFHRYCEDTVLVAHNAAFDMRFLQLKEDASGVRFSHPVVDTLLLSAVLHPALESHKLEAIAERLGVSVIGRHTALGDAMVTAEVFLKMIPQLANRGIVTLKDAQDASQQTYYARVRY